MNHREVEAVVAGIAPIVKEYIADATGVLPPELTEQVAVAKHMLAQPVPAAAAAAPAPDESDA